MNNVEIEARYEIALEEYTKRLQIEGRVLGDVVVDGVNINQLMVKFCRV